MKKCILLIVFFSATTVVADNKFRPKNFDFPDVGLMKVEIIAKDISSVSTTCVTQSMLDEASNPPENKKCKGGVTVDTSSLSVIEMNCDFGEGASKSTHTDKLIRKNYYEAYNQFETQDLGKFSSVYKTTYLGPCSGDEKKAKK